MQKSTDPVRECLLAFMLGTTVAFRYTAVFTTPSGSAWHKFLSEADALGLPVTPVMQTQSDDAWRLWLQSLRDSVSLPLHIGMRFMQACQLDDLSTRLIWFHQLGPAFIDVAEVLPLRDIVRALCGSFDETLPSADKSVRDRAVAATAKWSLHVIDRIKAGKIPSVKTLQDLATHFRENSGLKALPRSQTADMV